MEHSQEDPETTTESEGTKAQFSVRKMLLWTAIMAGGITIVTATPRDQSWSLLPQAFFLSIYTVFVWGILSFILDPKSFDVWFSAGMTGFLLFTPLVMAVFGPLLRKLIEIEITITP